ncbi:MAG: hypothetical protein NTV03_03230 [Candidatus Nomurabacteria bacterium]|nr:hypothetical protein [Candidatus Nomurabacteria bacterium]
MNKKFIIGIVILLVLTLFTIFYFKSVKDIKKNTQDEILLNESKNNIIPLFNFKIYKDFNLIIQFPQYWEIIKSDYSFLASPILKDNSNHYLYNLNFTISYFKDKNLEGLPLEQWIKKNDTNSSNQELIKIKIDNENGYKFYDYISDSNLKGYFQPMELYFPHGTDIYRIDYYEVPEKFNSDFTKEDIKFIDEYKKIVSQIIESIHFLK